MKYTLSRALAILAVFSAGLLLVPAPLLAQVESATVHISGMT